MVFVCCLLGSYVRTVSSDLDQLFLSWYLIIF